VKDITQEFFAAHTFNRGRKTLQVSRESVSFTDMKTGINILGTLQFRLVMHMSGYSAQHSGVFLTTSCVRKRRALGVLAPLIPMSRVSSGDWGSNDQ
jgi:hypothetical protein